VAEVYRRAWQWGLKGITAKGKVSGRFIPAGIKPAALTHVI